MNKKQIGLTIIALIAFVGIFLSSQNTDFVKDPTYATTFTTHQQDSTNVGFLIGGWIATAVVYVAFMFMLKTKRAN